jgi:hypothetical protein
MTTDTPEKDNHLVQAAKEMGAQEVKKPAGWDTTKSIDTVLGKYIKFHPELPKME